MMFHLSVFTLVGMSCFGMILINLFHDKNLFETLFTGIEWYKQIGIGVGAGIVSALIIMALAQIKALSKATDSFSSILKDIKPSFLQILFYSLCAGIGEEILFRAAFIPLFKSDHIAVWIVAILFVSVHGYLNPRNWRLSLIGIVLVCISAGFGYMFLYYGLLSAITAHFVYDVITFLLIKYSDKPSPESA